MCNLLVESLTLIESLNFVLGADLAHLMSLRILCLSPHICLAIGILVYVIRHICGLTHDVLSDNKRVKWS